MFQRYKRQLISGLAALFVLSAFVGVQFTNTTATHAASIITIDPTQQYQTLQGWGTSMAWWANIIGGWPDSKRVLLADALYDPGKGIGLNVVRYNFGADGPGNTCHNQMREGGNVASFEPTKGNYVWTNDANTFTAYNASTKSLVIVATNSGTSNTSVNYNLSNFSGVGSSATPYQTTASEKLAQLSTIGISNKTFSATLPGQSITTFVIPNVTTSGGGTASYYNLVNRNSGLHLDVSGASKAAGGSVIQWSNTGGTNQQWQLAAVS